MVNYRCPYCDESLEIKELEGSFRFVCQKYDIHKSIYFKKKSENYVTAYKKFKDSIPSLQVENYQSKKFAEELLSVLRASDAIETLKIENYRKKNTKQDYREKVISDQPEKVNSDQPDLKFKISPKSKNTILQNADNIINEEYFFKEFKHECILKILQNKQITVVDKKIYEETNAEYGKFSDIKINEKLVNLIKKFGIKELYKHQIEAFEKISAGRNVLITTPTASGKTEAFILPILNYFLMNPASDNTAFLTYPTKALAKDQFEKISEYCKSLNIRLSRLDGDTGSEQQIIGNSVKAERDLIIDSKPQIIITNIDFIHAHLRQDYPFSNEFKKLLVKMKFIVFDEFHKYDKKFGAETHEIILRLQRFTKNYQTIAASATIDSSEPEIFAKNVLAIDDISLITGKGSNNKKILYVLYPQSIITDDADEYSQSRLQRLKLISEIFIDLVSCGLKTMAFSNTRMGAEEIFLEAKESIECVIHRDGLLQEEKIKSQDQFAKGQVNGLVSTPTFELGIDIGDVDAVVTEFVPFSVLKQRIGRSGRDSLTGNPRISYGFMILDSNDPISRYYLENIKDYYKHNAEQSINIENKNIKYTHALFSAQDKPIAENELSNPFLKKLHDEKILKTNDFDSTKYMINHDLISQKALKNYSIRDIGARVEIKNNFTKIGEWNMPIAFEKLHPEAVYIHNGRFYQVKNFNQDDSDNLYCIVDDFADKNSRTIPIIEKFIVIEDIIESKDLFGIKINLCYIKIDKIIESAKMYCIDKNKTSIKYLKEAFARGFPTIGIEIDFTQIKNKLNQSPDFSSNQYKCFHTLEHLLIHAGNMIAGGIYSDIDGLNQAEKNRIYLFDRSANGGNGACNKLFDIFEDSLHRAKDILEECTCTDGCPLCIQRFQCNIYNKELNKGATKTMLDIILDS